VKAGLFAELRRRNVFRACAFYIAAVWAFGQGLSQFSPAIGLPDWATRWFLVAAAIGFPFWIAFAWLYEFTPEGLKRESDVEPDESITHRTGRKIDFAIIGVLAFAVVLLVTDRFVLHHGVNLEAAVDPHSIAVLPFVNMSSDKDQEYFSDGISEELLNLLTKIPQLRVVARTSSFSFKGKDVDVAAIAGALRVANVLEGSIRKSGNKIRISAQLIRTADSSHLWSQTYDRDLADIFAVQDEISAAVVAQLKVKLLGAAPTAKVVNPEAYALFLQARQLDRQRSTASFEQAMSLLNEALAIDANYAAAWDLLGDVYIGQANDGSRPIAEGYRLAREAANKALALEPDLASAHARLGRIAMNYDGDLAAAAQHYTQALALTSDDADIFRSASVFARSLGRLDTAIALCEAATARDPVFANGYGNLAIAHRFAGHLDEAIANARMALKLSPGYSNGYYNIGVALLQRGEVQAALAEIEREPAETWRAIGLPLAWHALGDKSKSDAALSVLIEKYEKGSSYNIAYVYAYRGESDKAFEWLDKSVATQDPGLSGVPVEPLFANLKNDARWLPFLRKVGKSPEQLAKIEFNVTLARTESATARGQTKH
jgi:TolB-like protein/Tfp pilus assembly protein PilF